LFLIRIDKAAFTELNDAVADFPGGSAIVSDEMSGLLLVRLARYYAFGYGVCKIDLGRAESLCRQSGPSSSGRALLGYLLWRRGDLNGSLSPLNTLTAQALSLWRQQPIDPWSAFFLTFVCAGNEQVSTDIRFSADTLLPALIAPLQSEAQRNDAWACNLLGCCYGWSKGVDESLIERDRWLLKASEQQCSEAQCHLYWESAARNIPPNVHVERAQKNLLLSAEQVRPRTSPIVLHLSAHHLSSFWMMLLGSSISTILSSSCIR
jgi:TPR repeat protein